MRHAARLPPPPVFWRSAFVAAICILQLAVSRSEFGDIISCAWYLHISTVICQFLIFSAISFLPGVFNILQMLLQRSNQNPVKMMPKSIKIDPQIILNRRKWCLGTLQKWSWKQVGHNIDRQNLPEPRFLRHLGDYGHHFVPSWAPMGSQNRAFWHQVALKP